MYVRCTISEGLRPSEVTVEVRDVDGRSEFLRVHRDFAKFLEFNYYLPIGIVYYDRDQERALIELPHEADSGTNRLWVPQTSLFEPRSQRDKVAV